MVESYDTREDPVIWIRGREVVGSGPGLCPSKGGLGPDFKKNRLWLSVLSCYCHLIF